MVPIRTLLVLLLGALLALTACGRPAPPTPIEVPGGGPSIGDTPPPSTKPTQPNTPPATNPKPPSKGPRLEITQGKSGSLPFELHSKALKLTASLSPQALTINGLPGDPVHLANPFGEMSEATLEPFSVGSDLHLLATLTNGRNVLVWVLAPGPETMAIALQTEVDWGAAIEGERVKTSWRKYKPEGGYVVVSDLYQYNPRSRQYEKAPA